MNIYLQLFLTFAKIGACTFGGGYAMLPILQREVVDNRGWATQDELADYFAIGQCTPGIIAVNTATFVGYKYKRYLGATFATLGLVFPSVVIISLIAGLISNFSDLPAVQHALHGVNACVIALIANSVLKLGKSTLKNLPSICIFCVVLALALAGKFITPTSFGSFGSLVDSLLSPAPLIVLAGLAGYILFSRKEKTGGDEV